MKKTTFTFIISAFIAFTACKSDGGKAETKPDNALDPSLIENPATASGNTDSKDKVPVFSFTEETHDFGTIQEGEKVSYAFRFKNSGNADMLIRSANGSCGCTVPEYPKDPVKPGQEAIINVTFDSAGKEGKQNKTITLIANTIPNTKVLTIIGEVIKK